MSNGKILIVDDDAFFRTVSTDILTGGGYAVSTAPGGAEAIRLIEREHFDIVLTDLVMPDIGGMDVLHRTKQHNTLIDVIVVTGHGSIESAIEALKSGAFDYIRKPVNEDELLHTVASCMEKKKLLEENQEMRQSLKLFEVSRAVTTTLDINRLYGTMLDALFQMVPAVGGFVVMYREDHETLELKAIRHIGLSAGEKVLKVFSDECEKDLRGLGEIKVLPRPDGRWSEDVTRTFDSILVAPLTNSGETVGFMLILSPLKSEEFSPRDRKNAKFIAEHASGAFENAQKYAEAKEMVYIDSLTNLYNSKYLELALDKEIKRAERLIMPLSVFFIDLDSFKMVNDRNDHLVGSKVLVEVSRILLNCVREIDTVIRYGGDEYVVIAVDADYEVALTVAERIRGSIEEHSFLADEGLDIKVTASIGVATYPLHTKDKVELLKAADKAMYRAKDLSRNVVYLAPLPGEDGGEAAK